MRILSFITLFFLCFICCQKADQHKTLNANDSSYNFRKTKWGMNKQEVRKSENMELITENKTPYGSYQLIYIGDVASLNCKIVYDFLNDKLVRAMYKFEDKNIGMNDYISDFFKLKDTLQLKYGIPTNDDTLWTNKQYKNDRSKWGQAISIGDLMICATWKLEETTISLALMGSLNVEYDCKNYGYLMEKEREKQRSKNF